MIVLLVNAVWPGGRERLVGTSNPQRREAWASQIILAAVTLSLHRISSAEWGFLQHGHKRWEHLYELVLLEAQHRAQFWM